ncbi:Zinc transporter ZIP6,Zinc transporter ZIP10,Zinc transporter foi [Mytilus edulis]|uniref:Zinc transporter ZIP6,Zinc transporter ZIP10,Zinc transporter foi n=1 Tax=Mytilus edulis TaxID=6550 RepID=A0A8S3VDS9_MYTED|nr:Zinc transporter ZIP6,Zinc transporter ZIP10,Zinc transporter foi [Mytilus edulis]
MPTTAEIYGYGILANAICCVCSICGAAILPCAKRFSNAYHVFLSIFMGLAVGTLFTGAVVHLIPEALGVHGHSDHEHEHEDNSTEHDHDDHEAGIHVENYIWYTMVVLLGTYAFYLLEMIMTFLKKRKGLISEVATSTEPGAENLGQLDSDSKSSKDFYNVNSNGQINLGSEDSKKEKGIAPLAYMIIIGDAIHNTTDGLVLGAAFSSDIADGIGLTIAIFCHELPQELGDFAVLITSGLSFCQAIWANLFSSLTAFIGFFVGVQVASYATAVNWIYAVTAGNFLYIALVDMLPELMKLGSKSWKTFCYHNIGIVTGALILVVVAVFEEHIEV